MFTIRDLNIEGDIVPLFDHTRNEFAKEELINMFKEPIGSKEAILSRQDTIKGFISNFPLLENFAYPIIDLREVHQYLLTPAHHKKNQNKFISLLELHLSQKERHQISSRIAQTILLLHKLLNTYFNRIKLQVFPASYQTEIKFLCDYLSQFQTQKYERKIRESCLTVTDLLKLSNHIEQQLQNGNTVIFFNCFFRFEALLSISLSATRNNFNFPILGVEKITIKDFYHPALRHPVKNSIDCSNSVLLLTGPNMSGKSTALKAISLCVFLAHIGLPVPAAFFATPHYDVILISLHHIDNLKKGYSHFLSDVMNIKMVASQILEGKRCFAVFDELFNGTTIEDALEISETVISNFAYAEHSLIMIATHLHPLKELDVIKNNKVDTFYLNCLMAARVPTFTYEINVGWSDIKVGKILFINEGLNQLLDGIAGAN